MSEEDISRFQRQADECRELAERARNPRDKQAWLRLAGDWIRLAQTTEERDRRQDHA
jgi:hypothetical protein